MQKYSSVTAFECEALVIGAGIAGCWTALKLAERGIDVALIFYDKNDRGGQMGSTNLSVGAISTAPLTRNDYVDWLEELGRGQVHPSVARVTKEYLEDELNALRNFDSLRTIDLGLALASGSARILMNQILDHLVTLGVRVLRDAWVTRVDADENICRGVQYQRDEHVGNITAASLVLASGGYSGLFYGSVRTGTFGSLQGRFLQAGGKLSNLEFIFKHGYGQPDLGKLTPTEELPGAEIYDEHGKHVCWLEEELFYGRGTHNHFQAFMTWRKAEDKRYFVDFRYCGFHRALKNFVALSQIEGFVFQKHYFSGFDKYISEQHRAAFSAWLVNITQGLKEYSFAEFNAIKIWLIDSCPVDKHRIRQIAYFSMGGIMHHGFLTNLRNVFVNGEAMHDYGAHRVGGLPWALYLCAARKIADDILTLKKRGALSLNPPTLNQKKAKFDYELLQEVQVKLASLENGKTDFQLLEMKNWFRVQRKKIECIYDDAYAYLLLAEAIVSSARMRRESRGCFFRPDYLQENYRLSRGRTSVSYNSATDEIKVDWVDKTQIFDLVFNRTGLKERIYGLTESNNAAFFLLKKHLATSTANFTAIVCGQEAWSYEELNQLVNQYAFFLFSQGLVRGDRVAIHMRDSGDWVAIFLAILQLGLIAVPINTFAKESDLLYYLEDSGAELLISEQVLLQTLNFELLAQRISTRIICIEDLQPLPQEQISCCVPVDSTTKGVILYTSGSTGLPKGAIHSHADIEFTAKSFGQENLQPQSGDRFYSTSRLFFAYGLGNSLTFPLYFGGTSVLTTSKISETETLLLLEREKINYFFSIPAIYAKLVAEADVDFSLLKLSISAGEPLSVQLGKQWVKKTSSPLLDGIGSTEAMHIFCFNLYLENGTLNIGRQVAGYHLHLLDDKNFVIDKPNQPGNLAISGGSLASGYWNNLAASKITFINDLLLTGDRYSFNELGEFIYLGRKGDIYKVAGLWVSSLEVEMALKNLAYLQDAAVISFLTDDFQQKTAAFIVPKLERVKNIIEKNVPSRIFDELPTVISRYKIPDFLFICAELPRTATGKIMKHQLKYRAESHFRKSPDQPSEEQCFNLLDSEVV